MICCFLQQVGNPYQMQAQVPTVLCSVAGRLWTHCDKSCRLFNFIVSLLTKLTMELNSFNKYLLSRTCFISGAVKPAVRESSHEAYILWEVRETVNKLCEVKTMISAFRKITVIIWKTGMGESSLWNGAWSRYFK